MSNPTSNFGWQMPTPTDLVTDLPADFEVFGQAVDTSLADLKGGTTGQILSKATNADMDFTWTTASPGDITEVTAGTGISGGGTSGAVTITNDMATTITAAGDIVVGTGSGTYDNLPIGTTGQILTADTSVSPYKVKWAAAAGGGKVLQVVYGSTTTALTSSTTTFVDTNLSATITPSSTSSKVLVLVSQGTLTDRGSSSCMFKLQIVRGSTVVLSTDRGGGISAGGASSTSLNVNSVLNYLDSPSTTSATTYKTQGATESATAGSVTIFQEASRPSTIILMEIGA